MTSTDRALAGRHALVTGASSGCWRRLASRLLPRRVSAALAHRLMT